MQQEHDDEELLHETVHVRVTRSRRDGASVIVKKTRVNSLGTATLNRIRYEHTLLVEMASKQVPHVLRPLTLESRGADVALISADIGARAVGAFMPLPVADVLHIAMQVAEALAVMHRLNVVHKDINPSNIVWNPQTREVQLIDFGIAARIAREAQAMGNVNAIEGTLDYVSPEQTGRLGRMLDHRSDFYSLGATVYELLTGRTPFVHNNDVTKLVHAVLAQTPANVCTVAPQVPASLGDIVAKLLQKQPEDRYQSAHGLLRDLQRCSTAGAAEHFALGTHDRNERFNLVQQLYGRESATQRLLEAYSTAAKGRKELIWITGPSGSGKSALVQQLQTVLLEKNGIFLSGKHDRLARHLPFAALGQALGRWVRHIMMEPEDTVFVWKRRIQEALGRVGQPILAIAPALEALVGKQPDVPALAPQETENRLMFLFERLLQTCSAERPVVIFLDDLQWADVPTLRFLGRWKADQQFGAGLLLIGAYRNEPVDGIYPLAAPQRDLEKRGMHIESIDAGPLSVGDVTALIADSTHAAPDAAAGLATLVHGKTSGNAFFVREFLHELAHQQLIAYNPEQNTWQWDLQAIMRATVTDVTASLMSGKMHTLQPTERATVAIAAILGTRFSLADLMIAAALPADTLRERLHASLQAGFIIPANGAYRYESEDPAQVWYRFSHDRVRDAAYALLDTHTRQQAHLRVGMQLWASNAAPQGEALFALVNHLNSAEEILPQNQRVPWALLNVRAGEEASQATAYEIAAVYFGHAIVHLANLPQHADTHRAALTNLAKSELLSGKREIAERRLRDLANEARTPQERAIIFHTRAMCLAGLSLYREAVDAGLSALAALDFHVPPNPTLLSVVVALVRLQRSLKGRPIADLHKAPMMASSTHMLLLRIIEDSTVAAYFVDANLYGVLILTTARLHLDQGNTLLSAYIYGSMAAVYGAIGNYPLANQYRHLSHTCSAIPELCNTPGKALVTTMTSLDYADVHAHDLGKAYFKAGLECLAKGDMSTASSALGMYFEVLKFTSVDDTVAEFDKHAGLNALLHEDSQRWTPYQRGCALCIAGKSESPTSLSHAGFDEAEELAGIAAKRFRGIAPITLFFNELSISTLQRRFDDAEEQAFTAIAGGILTSVGEHNAFSFDSTFGMMLAQKALAGKSTARGRKQLKRIHRRLGRIAAVSKPGVAHGVHALISAERLHIAGKHLQAAPLYENATRLLSESGYTGFAAQAHEAAGRFYQRLHIQAAAEAHLRAAVAAYRVWGALPKIAALEQEFGRIQQTMASTTATLHTTGMFDERLDIPALMRTTQALAAEVGMAQLVHKLVAASMEIAGATRGVLLLPRGPGDTTCVVHTDSAGPHQALAQDVVQAVARSQEPAVYDNLLDDPHFAKDPYVQSTQVHSAFCAPLIYQGVLRGVIYLENALVAKAFTGGRLELVKMLAAQAAVSIYNAQVYADLEGQVAQRTKQLEEAHTHLVKAQNDATEMRMAGGFAHEMRNALSAPGYTLQEAPGLLADADAAVLKLREGTDANAWATLTDALQVLREGIQVAGEGVRRGLRTTEQILAYAEVSQSVAGAEHLWVGQAVHSVLGNFAEPLRRDGVDVQVAIPDDLSVLASGRDLDIILRNLVDNAHTALCGKNVARRQLRVRAERFQGVVAVTVEDTGTGIATDAQGHIFEPFFTTKGRDGLGLGLGLSRKIARVYGGDLEFTSTPGSGTAFRLTFPTA